MGTVELEGVRVSAQNDVHIQEEIANLPVLLDPTVTENHDFVYALRFQFFYPRLQTRSY